MVSVIYNQHSRFIREAVLSFATWKSAEIREKCNLFIRFFLSGLAEDFSDMTADCDELLLQVSVDFEAVVTRISHHNVAVGG